jgi:hypothetical protein
VEDGGHHQEVSKHCQHSPKAKHCIEQQAGA